MADEITKLIQQMQAQEEEQRLAIQAAEADPFSALRDRYVDEQGNIRYGKGLADAGLAALTFSPVGGLTRAASFIPKSLSGLKNLYSSGLTKLGAQQARRMQPKALPSGTATPNVPTRPGYYEQLGTQTIKNVAPKVISGGILGAQFMGDDAPLIDDAIASPIPQEIDLAGLPQLRQTAVPTELTQSRPEQGLPRPPSIAPVEPKKDSSRLGLMLYALGGALKGDKNFMQNTLALQNMQEGKKKEAERKKNFDDFLKTLDPDSSFYDLAKSIGHEGLPKLLLERYKLETTPAKEKTLAQMRAESAIKVKGGGKLTQNELNQLIVIDPKIADLLYTNPELFEPGIAPQEEKTIEPLVDEETELEKILRKYN